MELKLWAAALSLAAGTAVGMCETQTMTIYDLDEGYLRVPYEASLPHHDYDWDNLSFNEDGFLQYEEASLGIDVSRFQGDIDWQQVATEDNIDFAIMRLGFRGYESGKLVLDEKYVQNMEGAAQAGLTLGVYFFSQAVNVEEAVEEADFVCDNLAPYDVKRPVVFDTEKIKFDSYRTENLSKEELTAVTKAFCNRIKERGYQPMIYANAKWLSTRLNLSELTEFEVWYADYEYAEKGEEPLYPYWFSMWQYTNKGKIPGIKGDVDVNIYLKSGSE